VILRCLEIVQSREDVGIRMARPANDTVSSLSESLYFRAIGKTQRLKSEAYAQDWYQVVITESPDFVDEAHIGWIAWMAWTRSDDDGIE
jgi:hypothetical protein